MSSSSRSVPEPEPELDLVMRQSQLVLCGYTRARIAAEVAGRRWQRIGPVIVRHNGPLSVADRRRVATLCCGPRAVLTSFSALEVAGLRSWERDEVHVLAPGGTTRPRLPSIELVLHRAGKWSAGDVLTAARRHRVAPAAVLAASSFDGPRPGCGLLAAVVQQRLAPPGDLRQALVRASRTLHRAVLLSAIDDISMGAHALSEIDFGRLCRRRGIPPPTRQAVRVEPSGRRRYLDAWWHRADGREVSVEVDGALHMTSASWFADSVRLNELVLGGVLTLRYPSVVVRTDENLVTTQLRRALLLG